MAHAPLQQEVQVERVLLSVRVFHFVPEEDVDALRESMKDEIDAGAATPVPRERPPHLDTRLGHRASHVTTPGRGSPHRACSGAPLAIPRHPRAQTLLIESRILILHWPAAQSASTMQHTLARMGPRPIRGPAPASAGRVHPARPQLSRRWTDIVCRARSASQPSGSSEVDPRHAQTTHWAGFELDAATPPDRQPHPARSHHRALSLSGCVVLCNIHIPPRAPTAAADALADRAGAGLGAG